MEDETVHQGRPAPYVWTADEALALCDGRAVQWHGSIAQLDGIPWRFEMVDGWLSLKRRDP